MTLNEIITLAACYLEHTRDELIINDIDLGLSAINQARRNAEQSNDFNFTQRLLQLSVDGVTGGNLTDATLYGVDDSCDMVSIKTIIDMGVFDSDGNFMPVEWTTVSDSLNRQRQDNPMWIPRFPTDAQAVCSPIGQRRFVVGGNRVFYFPKTPNLTILLGIIANIFTNDWDDDDVDDDSPPDESKPWLLHGSQYLQWATVIQLNQLYKGFVFRQEGNLPPPQTLADAGLAAMQTWDNFRFEQHRRHSR